MGLFCSSRGLAKNGKARILKDVPAYSGRSLPQDSSFWEETPPLPGTETCSRPSGIPSTEKERLPQIDRVAIDPAAPPAQIPAIRLDAINTRLRGDVRDPGLVHQLLDYLAIL